ncbi:MAG: serine hydrolase [Bacteroidota bacterium]|nr:serine hydrolase [Bacteroidota bacterium]
MKNAFFCTLLTVAAQLPLTQSATAQPTPKQLETVAAAYAKAGQLNGTVLVADHGKIIFSKGYGLANREWNQPNAPDTKFRLGSLTKQFTAMLVMQLVEQGKLRLDAHISDYLPDYPKATGDKITLHQLLTHTAGIPSYTSQPSYASASLLPTTPAAFVATFSGMPLDFEPGTSWKYSNSGYFLLGVIIEKVAGKPYEQVLSEQILKPLHMQDSGFDLAENILPHRAAGYDRTPEGLYNTTYVDMSVPYAAGALYATVGDLYKWDQALYSAQLLSEAGKARMFRADRQHYAYGWLNMKMAVGADSVGVLAHSGHVNGFGTYLLRVPQDHQLVVVLDNEGGQHVQELSLDLLRVLHQQPTKGPQAAPKPTTAPALPTTPVAVDAATLAGYVGKYALNPTFAIAITADKGRLYAQATGQQRFDLVATAANRFALQGVPAELEFVKNAAGATEKLILHQGGMDQTGRKVE